MEAGKITFLQQLHYAFTDTWTIAKRNVIRNFRLPQLIFFSSVQPIMFLLLFNFVFGGAVAGDNYIRFLLPGILMQSVLFGVIQTGVGLAEDMQKGVVDRFRSLPMSRVAHISGRIIADAMRNILVVLLMVGVGHILGFRFENGFLLAVVGIGFAVFFGFAFSWIAALFGLITKDSETAQVFGFIWTFPLVFASSVFVPVETMPGWLQVFANNQPITHAVNAVRSLSLGGSMDPVWKALAWTVGIVVVVAPIAIMMYRKASD